MKIIKKIFITIVFVTVIATGISIFQENKAKSDEEYAKEVFKLTYIPIYNKKMVRPENSKVEEETKLDNSNAAMLAYYMDMEYLGDTTIISHDESGNIYEYKMSYISDYDSEDIYGVYQLDKMDWNTEEEIYLINSSAGHKVISKDQVMDFKLKYRDIIKCMESISTNTISNYVMELNDFCNKNGIDKESIEAIANEYLFEQYGSRFLINKNKGILTEENGRYYARYIIYNLSQGKYESVAIDIENKQVQITPFYFK